MKLDDTLKLLALPVLGIVAVALLLARLGGERDQSLSGGKLSTSGVETRVETDALGFEFVPIPAGSFVMGGAKSEGKFPEEAPPVQANIDGFLLGRFEVTQQQWFDVMGANPSAFKDPRKPVDSITWYDIEEFIKRLNERAGAQIYRLPSEAEWEYAVRAGTTTDYYYGDDAAELERHGWIGQEGNVGTRPVGQREPNPWGLFDVYGNVWEWVADCWHDDYQGRPADARPWVDPAGCKHRVLRGGGWNTPADRARSSSRGTYPADLNDVSNGFRLAKTRGPEK